MIPKIIMQTWKNHNIPDKWSTSPESIKKYMSDWEYVLMTDSDNLEFVTKHFPNFLPYYKAFPYNIQRADAIRYLWLYVNGGLYLDLDIEITHDLTELFSGNNELYLVSSGNVGSCITNSFMASKPGCKIWLEMIEQMKKTLPWWCIGKHMKVMNSTGPVALNSVVKNSNISYHSLATKLVMPCSVCDSKCDTKDAWLKPLEGSSWVSYDTKFLNFWLCHWKKIVIVIICVLIILTILFLILFLYEKFKIRDNSESGINNI